jgi:hypothetical protein
VIGLSERYSDVVVWGNCQAEPIAELLRVPLAEHGLVVTVVPPVYLIDADGLAHVRDLVRGSAHLISQPIGEDYSLPGCSTAALAALLPPGSGLTTFPVSYYSGAFPFQINAHGADGARVLAPITDYHDLRAVSAAARGWSVEQALAWWPAASTEAAEQIAAQSSAELRRREAGLDIAVSHLVTAPGAMMTISHPSNDLLGRVAAAVLQRLGLSGQITLPVREFLGARQAPREATVVAALGWPADAVTTNWLVDGRSVGWREMIDAHLAFYRDRPDVVTDCLTRYAKRLDTLGL